jgi:hypothetical protein
LAFAKAIMFRPSGKGFKDRLQHFVGRNLNISGIVNPYNILKFPGELSPYDRLLIEFL